MFNLEDNIISLMSVILGAQNSIVLCQDQIAHRLKCILGGKNSNTAGLQKTPVKLL